MTTRKYKKYKTEFKDMETFSCNYYIPKFTKELRYDNFTTKFPIGYPNYSKKPLIGKGKSTQFY